MSNVYDDMRHTVNEAKVTLRAADGIADDMARLLIGRLRHVGGHHVLAKLKKELKDFNAHTQTWKK